MGMAENRGNSAGFVILSYYMYFRHMEGKIWKHKQRRGDSHLWEAGSPEGMVPGGNGTGKWK